MLLDGLTILSFCHFLQGPAAMQYLADMGADVIKIEPPSGAFERHWSGADCATVGGVSALFLCANRNVRSLSLDLKHPEAKDVVFRLLDRRHVLAENYRPGALDRLGVGYEAVRTRKRDIIYDFADLATALDAKAIWYAKVDDYDDLFANPQAQHNQTFKDVTVNDETVRLLNHPLRYDGSVPGYRSFPLTQGADTRPVLEEIGFTSAEVNELFRNGVAFAGE